MRPSAKVTIMNTFRQLIQNKSIDKITVTEICEKAEINRQTFYNHFSDLFDIFKHLFQAEISEEIAQNKTFETWCGGVLADEAMYVLGGPWNYMNGIAGLLNIIAITGWFGIVIRKKNKKRQQYGYALARYALVLDHRI